MPKLSVHAVDCPGTKRDFLKLPRILYRNAGIPLLPAGETERLAGLASFAYYQPDVERAAFIVRQDGKCAGRIAVNIHPDHARLHLPRAACFGFYESINDGDVSRALLSTVCQWSREHSAKRIIGPYSPSVNYYSGLRISEFDQTPIFFSTCNPPCYVDQIQQFGFAPLRDMLAYRLRLADFPTPDPRTENLIDEASRRIGLTVDFARSETIDEDLNSLMQLYNSGLQSMWGYVPLGPGEQREFATWLKNSSTPESIVLARVNGEVIGGAFGLVDINPLLVSGLNRALYRMLGWRFLRLKRKRLKRFRIVAEFVVPGYIRWGVGPAILRHFVDHWTGQGLTEAEISWVYDNNLLSRRPLEKWGLTPVVTHRIYEKQLD